jgi:hypothetical protein
MLIKGAFVGEKNFECYQNERYNNKKKCSQISCPGPCPEAVEPNTQPSICLYPHRDLFP